MFQVDGYGMELKPLTPASGDILKEVISRIQIPYVLSFGTALGLYREGDFIKNDTDIDIDVIGFDGLEEYLKSKLYDYSLFRLVRKNGVVMQAAFVKNDTVVDFSFYWGEELLETHREDGKWIVDRSYIEKPHKIKTKYGTLNLPNSIEKYLTDRYGDWKTPTNSKALYQ